MRAIDVALTAAADWLARAVRRSSPTDPSNRRDTVARAALVLWALARSGAPLAAHAEVRADLLRLLLAERQLDGGIYRRGSGLAVYTSGIALRAITAMPPRERQDMATGALRGLELYVYRARIPESWADVEHVQSGCDASRAALERLLRTQPKLAPEVRRALAFLERSDPDGARVRKRPGRAIGRRSPADPSVASYDEVLSLAYREIRPEHSAVRRFRHSLGRHYAIDRNPVRAFDGVRSVVISLGERPHAGLYYYYFVLGRVLAGCHSRTLVMENDPGDAKRRQIDVAQQLAARLLATRRTDGSWVNDDASWWEDDPVVVTSYAILALAACRDVIE